MNKKAVVVLFVLIVLTLVGCTRSASTPPAYVSETEKPTKIPPTETAVPTATSTTEPTPTNSPTNTPAPTATQQIEGIPEDVPYKEAMYWAHNNGFTELIDQEPQFVTYKTKVRRSEMALMFCKIIYEGKDLPEGTGTFDDVDPIEDPELSACLEQLFRDECVSGTSTAQRLFSPEKYLDLGALAVFHLRGLFNDLDSDDPQWVPSGSFEGDPWGNYYEAVWAQKWGEYLIRNGYYDLYFGRFNASQPATLAEVSMALYSIAHK